MVNKTGSLWSNAVPSAKSRSWLRTSSGNSKRHSAWIICVRKTLHVLVFGLVRVALFESVLTALRTYVFSHTTIRIDVELERLHPCRCMFAKRHREDRIDVSFHSSGSVACEDRDGACPFGGSSTSNRTRRPVAAVSATGPSRDIAPRGVTLRNLFRADCFIPR